MTGGPGLAFHLQSPGKAAAWPARAAELQDWDGARECHRTTPRRPSEARLAPERWPGAEPFPPTTLARERDRSWLGGLVLRLVMAKLAMVRLRGPARCREPPDRLGARTEAAPRPARNPLNRSPRPEWTSVPRSSRTGAVAQGGASSRGRRPSALSTLAAEAAAPVDDFPGQLPLDPVPDEEDGLDLGAALRNTTRVGPRRVTLAVRGGAFAQGPAKLAKLAPQALQQRVHRPSPDLEVGIDEQAPLCGCDLVTMQGRKRFVQPKRTTLPSPKPAAVAGHRMQRIRGFGCHGSACVGIAPADLEYAGPLRIVIR